MRLPTAKNAQKRLQTLLRESGVNVKSPPLADFWPVFKRFAAEDFGFNEDNGSDGFLVEYFVPSSLGSEELPLLDFVRQFSYNDAAGEYDHMEQMRCVFNYEKPLGDPSVTSDKLWSFQMPLDEYFVQIEAMPVFQAALASVPLNVEWVAGKV